MPSELTSIPISMQLYMVNFGSTRTRRTGHYFTSSHLPSYIRRTTSDDHARTYATRVHAQAARIARPVGAADVCAAGRHSIAAHCRQQSRLCAVLRRRHTAKAPCSRDVRHAVLRCLGGRDDLGHLLLVDKEEILHGGTTGRRDSQLPWLWDGHGKDSARGQQGWL